MFCILFFVLKFFTLNLQNTYVYMYLIYENFTKHLTFLKKNCKKFTMFKLLKRLKMKLKGNKLHTHLLDTHTNTTTMNSLHTFRSI